MVLSAAAHHSFDKVAAGEQYYGRQAQKTDAVFFELFDEDTARVRPTVEHIVDFVRFVPMVQILDALVPQMVEQLPDIMRFFDTLTPDSEQVIEVPKILPDDVTVRTAVRDTQLAEHLVEVATIVSFS